MKIKGYMVLGFFFVAMIIIGLCDKSQTQYQRTGIIVDKVTIVDTTGNEWEYIDHGFNVGEEVVLQMNTNHTDENITDDIIEKISKK